MRGPLTHASFATPFGDLHVFASADGVVRASGFGGIGETAAIFRVDPKTVTRWAKVGKLSSIRTLGGHRRFRELEVRALLLEAQEQAHSA